jgi:hypothetical protein
VDHKVARAEQCPSPYQRGATRIRSVQPLLQPDAPCAPVSAGIPEPPQRGGQAQGKINLLVFERPTERRAEIVVVLPQADEPLPLPVSTHCPIGPFSQIQEVQRVSARARLRLAALQQLFVAVLSESVQQSVTCRTPTSGPQRLQPVRGQRQAYRPSRQPSTLPSLRCWPGGSHRTAVAVSSSKMRGRTSC